MTTNDPGGRHTDVAPSGPAYPEAAPGDGWMFFAGTILGLAGLMRLVDSFWAFRYNGALPATSTRRCWGTTCRPMRGCGWSSAWC